MIFANWNDPSNPMVIYSDHRVQEGVLILYRIGDDQIMCGPEPSPRILISDELLFRLVTRPGSVHPRIELVSIALSESHPRPCQCSDGLGWEPGVCYLDRLFKLDVSPPPKLIYRIVQYEYQKNAWWAEWPD